jgi:2-iminobutanoate/2-iminopropanoate deaminase
MKHFSAEHVPARLCYGGVDLAGECKIEMAVIATKKDAPDPIFK